MGKQRHIEGAQVDRKGQFKAGRTVVQELEDGLIERAQLPGGPIAAAGDGSVGVQAAWLRGPFVQTAQQRALAAQIGRMQGNGHLRRVVASLKQDREPAAVPVASPPVEQGSSQQESVATFHLSARIPRAGKPGASAPDPVHLGSTAADSDAFEGQEEEPTVEEVEPGKVVEEESDSIDAKGATHKPTISEGEAGLTTSQAGRCRWVCEMKGVSVASGEGEYTVTATAQCTITWQVHPADGLLPTRTNVESGTDAAITKDNYTQVASDLMPRKTKPRRSPRTQFWSRDLTIIHEKFHADERANKYGKEAFKLARTWLSTQTATSEEQVKEHVDKIPSKMSESFAASYKPKCEHRAYDDGAPLYEARSKKIKSRGDKGEYK